MTISKKKSYKFKNFSDTIKYIEDNKHITLQKLIAMPFEKLYEMEKYYHHLSKDAEESGYTESAEVNALHCRFISEAIDIKRGNEEQAWDYLS